MEISIKTWCKLHNYFLSKRKWGLVRISYINRSSPLLLASLSNIKKQSFL